MLISCFCSTALSNKRSLISRRRAQLKLFLPSLLYHHPPNSYTFNTFTEIIWGVSNPLYGAGFKCSRKASKSNAGVSSAHQSVLGLNFPTLLSLLKLNIKKVTFYTKSISNPCRLRSILALHIVDCAGSCEIYSFWVLLCLKKAMRLFYQDSPPSWIFPTDFPNPFCKKWTAAWIHNGNMLPRIHAKSNLCSCRYTVMLNFIQVCVQGPT